MMKTEFYVARNNLKDARLHFYSSENERECAAIKLHACCGTLIAKLARKYIRTKKKKWIGSKKETFICLVSSTIYLRYWGVSIYKKQQVSSNTRNMIV